MLTIPINIIPLAYLTACQMYLHLITDNNNKVVFNYLSVIL